MAQAKAVKIPKTVGGKIDNLVELNAKRLDLEQQVKAIVSEYNLITDALMEQMEKENMGTTASSSTGSVRISDSVVPTVKDWDSFYAFIYKNKYFHLLERRPSVTGCRELFETKGAVPGVEPFVKLKLVLSPAKTKR